MKKALFSLLLSLLALASHGSQQEASDSLEGIWTNPPPAAQPWVFWYWMEASISREGIQADLEAVSESGIAGAYLMPIKGPPEEPLMDPVVQLTPEWWGMVKYAFEEAGRLGLKLTIHACDGFAVAGGPWITPELSMQKVVWSESVVEGGHDLRLKLAQPESFEGYYRDIALYAIRLPDGGDASVEGSSPVVTTSTGDGNHGYLLDETADGVFRSREPAWIQYTYDEPFMARSVEIHPQGTNFGAKRLLVEASDDGKAFFPVRQLEPPRHGWQDGDAPLSYAIPSTRARYFRFSYDPSGTEPGAEDLDSAKWRPSLSIRTIDLSGRPIIDQYEGKSAAAWRISRATGSDTVPDYLCHQPASVLRLSPLMMADGSFLWEAPPGRWLLLRMGHTSTGHTNYTGGGGLGLEVDKLNGSAVELQYDSWFGKVVRQVGPELAKSVLHGFHVDSWECGSQNWTTGLPEAFKDQHGYDPLDWLPVMAGYPLSDVGQSEAFLEDLRETINRLLQDNFFRKLKTLANGDGYHFSAESVAPTMMSDGMEHHGIVDLPMGEFWLRSPTHDKPNDILDAISGGHVHGKPIIQAEAFTQVRMAWDEHPGNLKVLGDRMLAMGINRFVFHVFTHNPWLDRAPGMTLDGVGLYFQRDQTWWKPGRAWLDYLARCQAFLQAGKPHADIAVYTGDALPRRAILPDRLIGVLPGLIGAERVKAVKQRLRNTDLAIREEPRGVFSAANVEDPADWTDPLNGYAYDSLNQAALLSLAKVEDGVISFPGGAAYSLLVVPGKRRMSPEGDALKGSTIRKLYQLIHDGATVLFESPPRLRHGVGLPVAEAGLETLLDELWGPEAMMRIGKGRVLRGPWLATDLSAIGLSPDCVRVGTGNEHSVAWNHRRLEDGELYFLSNQSGSAWTGDFSFRVHGLLPELWDPVTGERGKTPPWRFVIDRTEVELQLPVGGSAFVVFRRSTAELAGGSTGSRMEALLEIDSGWQMRFDPLRGGPAEPIRMEYLSDWRTSDNPAIRHFSGTAVYEARFRLEEASLGGSGAVYVDLGTVHNLARVFVNGIDCGVAWTDPMRLEVTGQLRLGENHLRIEVTNTWANRLIGDREKDQASALTWTRAPYRLGEGPLLPAGLLGPVRLLKEYPHEK
ncbi:MAG: glycosyl hydrolase [Puniceicoccaceae bacterium]